MNKKTHSNSKKDRVFVTGASGKIGKNLSAQLIDKNYKVVALVRNKSNLPLRHPNLKIIEADILELNKFKKEIRNCDYVYHLAVYQNPIDPNKKEFIRVNVMGTESILKTLIGSKVKRFIYISTVMVFKSTGKIGRSEKWPKRVSGGKNHYVETKLQALRVVDGYKSKIPIMTLYPTIVIDIDEIIGRKKSQNYGWHSMVRNIIGGGVPGAVMSMVGNRNRIQNYIFLENLVNAMINAMDKGKAGEDYILGGENITAENYLREIARIRHNIFFPIRIPILLLKTITLIKIPQLKLIDFIVKNPPEDMCIDSQKAVNDLGLKFSRLQDYP